MLKIGYGNSINEQHLIAIVSPDSSPVKRMISDVRDNGMLVDATKGKRTRSVLVMNSRHIVISALSCEALAERRGKA